MMRIAETGAAGSMRRARQRAMCSFVRAFGLAAAVGWNWLLGAAARAAQHRALGCLDDRLLRDIGLERNEAEAEARKPFWLD